MTISQPRLAPVALGLTLLCVGTLTVLTASPVVAQGHGKSIARITEWGTIGELKPFITRQMTQEEYKSRFVCHIECQIRCSCLCGHCCCRICPVEVLHEELYAVHSRMTFVYGPPMEVWVVERGNIDNNGNWSAAADGSNYKLVDQLPYFSTEDVDGTEDLRFQGSVRHPKEVREAPRLNGEADDQEAAQKQFDIEKRRLVLAEYSWGQKKVTLSKEPAEHQTLALIWNVHNDVDLLKKLGVGGGTIAPAFEGTGSTPIIQKLNRGAKVPCGDLQYALAAGPKDGIQMLEIARVLFVVQPEVLNNAVKNAELAKNKSDELTKVAEEALALATQAQMAADMAKTTADTYKESANKSKKEADRFVEDAQKAYDAGMTPDTKMKLDEAKKSQTDAMKKVDEAAAKVKEADEANAAAEKAKTASVTAKTNADTANQEWETAKNAAAKLGPDPSPNVEATWGKKPNETAHAPFKRIRDHFKIDREFKSIRTYDRDLP